MQQALQRQKRGEVQVIPILVRPIHWEEILLGRFQSLALPQNSKPVTDRSWNSLDDALFDVAAGIRILVEDLTSMSRANVFPARFSALWTDREKKLLKETRDGIKTEEVFYYADEFNISLLSTLRAR